METGDELWYIYLEGDRIARTKSFFGTYIGIDERYSSLSSVLLPC